MKKTILKNALLLNLSAILCAVSAHAEDVFIDCSVPNEQCRALYQSPAVDPNAWAQVANPQAPAGQPYHVVPVARSTVAPLAVSQPYQPQPETLILVNGQPVAQRVAGAPVFAQGLNPGETFQAPGAVPSLAADVMAASGVKPYAGGEPEREYQVRDMANGSIVTQKEKTVHKNEDGSVIEVSRVKETVVSPKYVEMPAISEVQRHHKLEYGATVHDWEAPKGETLRTLLMDWGEKSGWTIVWQLERDYVLEAGVVFRGTFTDVASAILRTFARAMPAPVGTFYNGNRVLLITTQEDDNAQ